MRFPTSVDSGEKFCGLAPDDIVITVRTPWLEHRAKDWQEVADSVGYVYRRRDMRGSAKVPSAQEAFVRSRRRVLPRLSSRYLVEVVLCVPPIKPRARD